MLFHPSFSSPLINENLPAGPQLVFTLNNRFSATKHVTVCFQPSQADRQTASSHILYTIKLPSQSPSLPQHMGSFLCELAFLLVFSTYILFVLTFSPLLQVPVQALYANISLLEHSCINNASKHFDGDFRNYDQKSVHTRSLEQTHS
jgi:hypothetical protein